MLLNKKNQRKGTLYVGQNPVSTKMITSQYLFANINFDFM